MLAGQRLATCQMESWCRTLHSRCSFIFIFPLLSKCSNWATDRQKQCLKRASSRRSSISRWNGELPRDYEGLSSASVELLKSYKPKLLNVHHPCFPWRGDKWSPEKCWGMLRSWGIKASSSKFYMSQKRAGRCEFNAWILSSVNGPLRFKATF